MAYLANKLGDANDVGFFATPAALNAAYPVGFPGAFAIVGSTDTIWVWDEGTMTWVDTGTAPAVGVTSLNTLTGAVTLAAGANITLTPVGNTITIAASAAGASTLAQVSAGSLTAPNSLYTMSAGIPVEFRSTGAVAVLLIDETTEQVSVNALNVTGTGGDGVLNFVGQSVTPATPPAGTVRLYAEDTGGVARMRSLFSTGSDLAFFRDGVQRVFNATGSTILAGQAVYVIGQSGGFPSVVPSLATVIATSFFFGLMTTDTPAASFGTAQFQGVVQNIDTSAFLAGDILWISDTVPGELVNVEPTSPSLAVKVGVVLVSDAVIGEISIFGQNPAPTTLDNLSDVTITAPMLDDFLRFNGTEWVNSPVGSSSAGPGVAFYNATPSLVAAGTNNITEILTLSKIPIVTAEQTITGTGDSASTPIPFGAWLYDTALDRTVIDGGVWTFRSWANINNTTGTTTISRGVYAVLDEVGGVTGASTGAGTSRTFTASGGTPFAVAKINVGGTALTDSYLTTPQGIYRITARTSDTVVTIAVPTTYANETTIAFSVWQLIINSGESSDISTTTASGNYQEINLSIAVAPYTITLLHKLGAISFVTSTASRVVTVTYDGNQRNTHFTTPLVTLHNQLAGLQGGAGDEFFHLTLAQYTIATQAATTSLSGYLTDTDWDTFNNKMGNPMTTQGDSIYGGVAGIPTRLAIGTAGQVWTVNAGATAPEWADGGGGVVNAFAETPSGAVNSSNVTYTLANTPADADGVVVLLDGITQYNGIDYTMSGTTITFGAAPATGSTIFAYYNTFTVGGGGTVTSVGIATANGVSGSAAITTAGNITITLGAITPTSIANTSLIGTTTLTENASIALDPAQSDQTYTGITRTGTAGATLAFGDLCYLAAADSRWELTDADSVTTADRLLGMCVLAAAADGSATVMLLMGNIQAASKFPAMTIGSAMYVSDVTAGAIQVAIPTGADNVIRRVGYALTADELYFNPSMDSQTTVA